MHRPPLRPSLGVVVFVVGTGSLGAEIAAARLLAPYFGASTLIWANTIGVVLVALSAGYWYGGKLADRDPTMAGLYRIVLLASALTAAVPFVADPFLGVAVDAPRNAACAGECDVSAGGARTRLARVFGPAIGSVGVEIVQEFRT